MDLHWCGYAVYFQDIQTPRSQFKRRNKFGLTRIFPTNTECKNCHQPEEKTTQHFVHTPSELKVIIACVKCKLWKIAWSSLSIRRFWGKSGKTEAKKGESWRRETPDTDAFTGAFHPHTAWFETIQSKSHVSGHWVVSFTCQKARLK